MTPIDSPSTTPTNTVDLTETEAGIQTKIVAQATARAGCVDLLIKLHRIIVALDTHCDSLEGYLERSKMTSYSDPADRAANKKKCQDFLDTWVSTFKDANLPSTLKTLPQEVCYDDRMSSALGHRADNIILFQRIFKAMLCGPVTLTSVAIDNPNTWFEYQEALRYAAKKERIKITLPILSSFGG
jgi:hypothetical protein